ncbi:uncharacterized protein BJ171DRAFT_472462 [Polychytrium aggregatum]|uniref:uncharacterized protein n=1 Tax=Polychytrium aggregatum TaxID=110093 RepID=UPI0022FDB744|nr:uncharacterized protein BJ171DRAFT_472462 [Polychytrium aggregatum]KAI9207596.1 hypothetical protein BJ171DRAFT_472462 [Polychytrium aggregatum]
MLPPPPATKVDTTANTSTGITDDSLYLLLALLAPYVDPATWTRLSSVSRSWRAMLANPANWRIQFQAFFRLPPRIFRADHHQVVVAAHAFLTRTRPQPYPCESYLWGVIHPGALLDRLREMCLANALALFHRWEFARHVPRPSSNRLENWIFAGSLPDMVGLVGMFAYEIDHSGGSVLKLPETVCFWKPKCIRIDSEQLHDLPRSFGCLLASLEKLEIRNAHVTELPPSFAGPDDIDASAAIVSGGSPAHHRPLQVLDLSRCSSLRSVEHLGHLPSLTDLNLTNCSSLESLEVISLWPSLSYVDLDGCTQLTTLGPLEGLSSLSWLDLNECSSLASVGSLACSSSLTFLNFNGCSALRSVGRLGEMPSLASVNLSGCTALESLSFLEDLVALESLYLSNCSALASIEPLARLNRLIHLNLDGCSALASLEPLRGCSLLAELSLTGCSGLSALSPIARLPGMRTLFVCARSPIPSEECLIQEAQDGRSQCGLLPLVIKYCTNHLHKRNPPA